jgi:hypothetical protein
MHMCVLIDDDEPPRADDQSGACVSITICTADCVAFFQNL